MKISDTVGIDVSKQVIDVRIHTSQAYGQFENTKKGFKAMCRWVYKNSSFLKEEIFFAFEHTGLYSHNLSVYLTDEGIEFAMISGLEIKRSLGLSRGKDDRVDATKIARYAYRLRDEIKPYVMPSKELVKLKNLLSLRERLVKQRTGFKATLKEQKSVLDKKENAFLLKMQKKMIKYLTKQIESTEKEMQSIIDDNDTLKRQYELITSIKSVGSQTALFMIVYTAGFTKFSNARKFASYCGVAPFPNTSGTSIMGKTKVSNLANKKIKSLLDQCAKSAIVYNYEMKKIYENRIENGKNKMSTINIVRNKLLARIFAVIKRESPYVDILKYAA